MKRLLIAAAASAALTSAAQADTALCHAKDGTAISVTYDENNLDATIILPNGKTVVRSEQYDLTKDGPFSWVGTSAHNKNGPVLNARFALAGGVYHYIEEVTTASGHKSVMSADCVDTTK